MRIALIHISQETNDFNPQLTTLADFKAFGLYEGEEIVSRLGTIGQIGGHFAAIERAGAQVQTIPIIRGFAVAGGRIDSLSRAFFLDRIRAGLKAAGKIDGLALQLHGACSAEGVDDVEGEQAALCREILGPDVPIVLGLDHHANVTDLMVRSVNAIVAHRTQPHDPHDTGVLGTSLLIRMVRENLKPVTVWRKIPLVSHQEQFLTKQAPMKTWFDRARAMERDPRVLQACPFPMQPWLDVDDGGWAVTVTTNGDRALADSLADDLADLCWSLRDAFQVREAVSVDDAVRMGDAEPRGVVVLSDTGDTVFGGSAGDSNVILEAVLRLKPAGKVLIPLIGPNAVAQMCAAGEGATVTVPLGAEIATRFFQPIVVTGTVRKIGGGIIRATDNHQSEFDMGRSVVFEAGSAIVLASELRGMGGNLPDIYRAFGIEPREHKMAVLKTASNFQYFAPITSRVIRADTRGPGQSDVFTLPWTRTPRPIYPLETFTDRSVRRSPPKA